MLNDGGCLPTLAGPHGILTGMQLPPFTWKSALLYLVGVAAVLAIVYFLVARLMETTPRQSITPRTQTTMVVASAATQAQA